MRAKNYDFLRKITKTEKNKKPPDQPTKRLYKRFYVSGLVIVDASLFL